MIALPPIGISPVSYIESSEDKDMFLNQCSQSLGEYTLISNAKWVAGLQVLRMENSFHIPLLTIELIFIDGDLRFEQQVDVYRGNSTLR